MRGFVVAALLFLSCSLPPHSDPGLPVPEIFRDYPELAEWGTVVWIGGREYWSPDPAYFVHVPGPIRHGPAGMVWAPYANGVLIDDAVDGLVWVSFDPWGFITEHFGYWRHHDQLGYVWRPFYPLRWSPYAATVLRGRDGHIVGLCPFTPLAWEMGLYDAGFGFDDDYWVPYWRLVQAHGFYAEHEERFAGACVTVSFYDETRPQRAETDSYHRRDREYRDRRHHRAAPPSPPQQDPPPEGAAPKDAMTVDERLPARPVATAPRPAPDAEHDPTPPAGGGLPAIPARELNVKRPPQSEPVPLPRAALETKEMRPAEPQRPARAESTLTRPAASAASTATRPASRVTHAESTASRPASRTAGAESTATSAAPTAASTESTVVRAAPAAAGAESSATRAGSTAASTESTATRGAAAKKAIEARVKAKK